MNMERLSSISIVGCRESSNVSRRNQSSIVKALPATKQARTSSEPIIPHVPTMKRAKVMANTRKLSRSTNPFFWALCSNSLANQPTCNIISESVSHVLGLIGSLFRREQKVRIHISGFVIRFKTGDMDSENTYSRPVHNAQQNSIAPGLPEPGSHGQSDPFRLPDTFSPNVLDKIQGKK